jgi:hypothetical protein
LTLSASRSEKLRINPPEIGGFDANRMWREIGAAEERVPLLFYAGRIFMLVGAILAKSLAGPPPASTRGNSKAPQSPTQPQSRQYALVGKRLAAVIP